MGKYIGILALTLLLFSCEDNIVDSIPDNYTMELDGRLDTTNEGFYLLDLNQTSLQTIHRITGQLLNNGEEPYPPQYVNWESSHSWVLQDTVGFMVRRVLTAWGDWVNVDTTYVTGFGGSIIPTINSTSVSGTNGEINTVIAPINEMVGDTMVVVATFQNLEKTIQIILQ
jgi:hypothetical protein